MYPHLQLKHRGIYGHSSMTLEAADNGGEDFFTESHLVWAKIPCTLRVHTEEKVPIQKNVSVFFVNKDLIKITQLKQEQQPTAEGLPDASTA